MSDSKLLEMLPEGYGYIIIVGVFSMFVNIWMARQVTKARKLYNIKYPTMYSADNMVFNCIQRAHQQTLELYPMFMTVLLLGGLQYPKFGALSGIVYLIGRIVYAKGYYTGEPGKRRNGAFGMVGFLGLLGSTLCLAACQLQWSLIPACLK